MGSASVGSAPMGVCIQRGSTSKGVGQTPSPTLDTTGCGQ